jgi:hypothetical protein
VSVPRGSQADSHTCRKAPSESVIAIPYRARCADMARPDTDPTVLVQRILDSWRVEPWVRTAHLLCIMMCVGRLASPVNDRTRAPPPAFRTRKKGNKGPPDDGDTRSPLFRHVAVPVHSGLRAVYPAARTSARAVRVFEPCADATCVLVKIRVKGCVTREAAREENKES